MPFCLHGCQGHLRHASYGTVFGVVQLLHSVLGLAHVFTVIWREVGSHCQTRSP